MISTVPFGSAVACEVPNLTAERGETPETSADFRPEGPIPETVADLLPWVDEGARRRWNKTFKLIVEWKGPAEEILLRELFRRSSMVSFRPFLREKGYLENSIVSHRKGLGYLRKLAASCGVQVEPAYKVAWREVMALAEKRFCMIFAEHFEGELDSPSDVTLEAVKQYAEELIRTRQKHMPAALRVRNYFLLVLRECGFIAEQPIETARQTDYGERLENLPEPLQSQLKRLRSLSLFSEQDDKWVMDWDSSDAAEDGNYRALRQVTADSAISSFCRFYGWVKNVCHKEEEINSLETLFREKVVRSYQQWLQKVRKQAGGSMQTTFSGMFSILKSYPQVASINLSWTTAFMRSIPKTTQNERNVRKAKRIENFRTLEMIPDKIRKDLNILIARHNYAERAEEKGKKRREGRSTLEKLEKARATRLIRMGSLAQSQAIIQYLTTLVWRNENLRECRINPDLSGDMICQVGGKKLEKPKKPNLWRGPVYPVPGMEIPHWAQERIDQDPSTPLLQFSFAADETKAGRPVAAVLPRTLVDITIEFVDTWRKILVEGVDDPHTLFVNQSGTSMTAELMERAVEEATLRYGGEGSRSVNPHLFRDIFAAAFLTDPEHYADYLTLSKILWHECVEVTVRTYSWIFNESVGTNAAGQFAEARDRKRMLRETGIQAGSQKHSAAGRIPPVPASGCHQRQHPAAPRRKA